MSLTICHASRGISARKEIPDLIPGDLLWRGTGMTFYGGGLGIGRVSAVARVAREIMAGRWEDSIAVSWKARDQRGEVIGSGPHAWSSVAVITATEFLQRHP